MLGPFKSVWAADFEFIQPEGEFTPIVVCLCARTFKREKIQLWHDQFDKNPPYSTAADSLFVAYSAHAELSCHLALDWPFPQRILDLYVEFKRATNTTPRDPRYKSAKLLDALTFYGMDGIGVGEKEFWRNLILSGGPWSSEERKGILKYCESDVVAANDLLRAMMARRHIDLPGDLLRGRYIAAVARMQATGVPLDMGRFSLLKEREESVKSGLLVTVGGRYEGSTRPRVLSVTTALRAIWRAVVGAGLYCRAGL